MKTLKLLISVLSLNLFLFSCSEEEDSKPALEIPSSYDATSFASNTATQSALKSQLAALTTEIKKGRAGTKITADGMRTIYNANIPSLKSVTTTYYASFLDTWFSEAEKASGGDTLKFNLLPAGNGGILGGYLFDNTGLEPEQVIEKGLFNAALYNHAVTLMQGNVTSATIDQILCIYGATPVFANTDNSSQGSNKDDFAAKYVARRTKSTGGFYLDIKAALIKAQAATKAGSEYRPELEEALTSFRQNWEKAMAATVINYLYAAISTLSATNPTDNAKASALHAYSEGVGFLHGFRTIPSAYKIITDGQIDQILILMKAPHNASPSSYLFVNDSFNQLPQLQKTIDELQKIYGFTNAQMEDFKKNWISEEKR
ncbi:MAG: hypothetical protein OHK0038_18140 [Flammeovirgaceae bacterium]